MGLAIGGFVLFGLGAVITVLMGVVLRRRRGEVATAERIAKTPATPIAEAQGGGVVEIHGTLLEGPEGSVRSPLSGRECSSYRIDVYTGGIKNLTPVHTERDRRPFWVDDGSGQRALVHPAEASVMTRYRRFGALAPGEVVISDVPYDKVELRPEQRAWIQAKTGLDGAPPSYAEERILAPGDSLYVLGWADRQLGRGGQWELVLRNGNEPERELLLSDLSEAEVLRVMAKRRRARRILFLIGVSLALAGLALVAYGGTFLV